MKVNINEAGGKSICVGGRSCSTTISISSLLSFQSFSRKLWLDETIRFPLLIFLVLRLATAIAAMIMVRAMPVVAPSWLATNPNSQIYTFALPTNVPLYTAFEPWLRYDTAWYIHNAIQGYQPGNPSIVFPPLYSFLIRVVVPVCAGNWVLASVLISNLACIAAFILLFKLVMFETGNLSVARRALICLAAFPTAYYLVAGYSEALYLACTLGAFLAAFRHKWLLSGILAGLAALTRLQGAALFLPLAWIAFVQYRPAGIRPSLARLPAIIGGPLGALSYLTYLYVRHVGSLDVAYEQKWRMLTRAPWDSLLAFGSRLLTGHTVYWENTNALALLFVVLLGLVALRTLRFAYALYIGSALAIVLLRFHLGPQFEGMPRYALIMFPCFMALGKVLRSHRLATGCALGGALWQLVLLNNFTHWTWVA